MFRYYQILKIQPGASLEELKRAYREQVKTWHPDRFPSNEEHLQKKAHEMFNRINEAFEKLQERHEAREQGRFAEDQPFSGGFRSEPGPSYEWDSAGANYQNQGAFDFSDVSLGPGIVSRTWSNGDTYEGQIVNGQPHGMGAYDSISGYKYIGQFRFGKPHGRGRMDFANGDCYVGEFLDENMHGEGKYTYTNGDRFIGQFQNDQPHGEGAFIKTTGKVYSGLWENGALVSEERGFGRPGYGGSGWGPF